MAKSDGQKKGILGAFTELASLSAKIEPYSNLIVFHIPKVPVKIITLKATETIDANRVSVEIAREI